MKRRKQHLQPNSTAEIPTTTARYHRNKYPTLETVAHIDSSNYEVASNCTNAQTINDVEDGLGSGRCHIPSPNVDNVTDNEVH